MVVRSTAALRTLPTKDLSRGQCRLRGHSALRQVKNCQSAAASEFDCRGAREARRTEDNRAKTTDDRAFQRPLSQARDSPSSGGFVIASCDCGDVPLYSTLVQRPAGQDGSHAYYRPRYWSPDSEATRLSQEARVSIEPTCSSCVRHPLDR
ncbi:hypothetical protein BJV78DRAFT_674626 [Lactifluus subvellereus]|nr:hypothetical protein BJV78DRAFT_674626 [Lactifluus subvellereus]